MANRYWVGGTASWDGTAGTKWSTTSGGAGGASVPTTADDVFIDANSGAVTVSIADGNTGAKSITFTGFTGTLARDSPSIGAITVAGNITLASTMVMNYFGTVTITADSTLISAGKSLPYVTVDGIGITVSLGDAMLGSGGLLTVTRGTFTTNNYSLSQGAISSSNSNARTISLGSSTVSLSGTSLTSTSPRPIDFSTSTNLTFLAGTSSISASGPLSSGSYLAIFGGSGVTFYNLSNTSNSGSGTERGDIRISGQNTFNNLTVSSTSVNVKSIVLYDNQTVNGTLSISGASAISRNAVYSSARRTSRTITAAAIAANNCDFRDITLSGAASPASPLRAGDCGGNSGITFPAAKTVYWNLSGIRNIQNTGWALSSGGTPAVDNFPLAQDTAVFDNTGAASTVSTSAAFNFGTIDMSGRTSALTFSVNSTISVHGDWKSGTGVVLSQTGGGVAFSGRKTQNVTSNGRLFGAVLYFLSDTFKPLDDLSTARQAILLEGTADLNGKTLNCLQFFVGNTVGSVVNKNLTFNGGTLTITGESPTVSVFSCTALEAPNFTTTAGTGTGKISMTGVAAKIFEGGGATYNCTLSNDGAGALTVTGSNTFTTIANGVQPTTLTFTAGTTQTVTNFNVNGTLGNPVTINSSSTSPATLSKSSGSVSVDYVQIQNSTATGGASWRAGPNSRDLGGNTGWQFGSGGNFLIFLQ